MNEELHHIVTDDEEDVTATIVAAVTTIQSFWSCKKERLYCKIYSIKRL